MSHSRSLVEVVRDYLRFLRDFQFKDCSMADLERSVNLNHVRCQDITDFCVRCKYVDKRVSGKHSYYTVSVSGCLFLAELDDVVDFVKKLENRFLDSVS